MKISRCDMTMASLPHLGRINQEVLNLAFSVPPPTSSKPPSRSLPIAALMGFLGAISGKFEAKWRKFDPAESWECGCFTHPKSNSKLAPENGWLEDDRFLLGWPVIRGELLVLGSVSPF